MRLKVCNLIFLVYRQAHFEFLIQWLCNSQGFRTPWWWLRLSGRNMLEWLIRNKLSRINLCIPLVYFCLHLFVYLFAYLYILFIYLCTYLFKCKYGYYQCCAGQYVETIWTKRMVIAFYTHSYSQHYNIQTFRPTEFAGLLMICICSNCNSQSTVQR